MACFMVVLFVMFVFFSIAAIVEKIPACQRFLEWVSVKFLGVSGEEFPNA